MDTKVKLIIPMLVALVFLSPFAYAIPGDNSITVKILKWDFYPKEVNPGQTVDVTAKIQITLTVRNPYDLLVESSIVPQNVPYSILPFLKVIPDAKCCPGNDNFADAHIQETYSEWHIGFPYTVTETVHLQLKAPTPDSYDHCAVYGSERRKPGYYWNGPGNYLITLSVWNGCAKDVGSNLIKYAGDYKTIRIVVPPSQNKQTSYCGNGVCDPGENSQTCPQDCNLVNQAKQFINSNILGYNIKVSDVLIFLGIFTLVYYAWRRKS